jgi:hypothetical protein
MIVPVPDVNAVAVPVTVTVISALTLPAETGKVADVDPAGTVTVLGTAKAGVLLDRLMTVSVADALLIVTVPVVALLVVTPWVAKLINMVR